MKPFRRNHDSVKEDNSREEIKERDHDFKQNENDSDSFIDDVDLQEDFTNDPSNQIPVFEIEDVKEELHKKSEYEKNMQDNEKDGTKWKEEEWKSLKDGYVNYYDTARLIMTDYEHVSTNQSLLTNLVYLLLYMLN